MTKKDEDDLNFLLKESESRELTNDEKITVYEITKKRIQEIEKKAIKRLSELSKKDKPKK
ncbi:hypothetical protein R84B8_00063 [Treponema sp. R8-4-B8]